MRSTWRELARFDDPLLARAVATSVAAMEFDVRLCPSGVPHRTDDDTWSGRAPYVIQVEAADWPDLADVLDEIVEEQIEFDRLLAGRRTATRPARLAAVIGLTGAVDLVLLLALMDW